MRNRLLASSLVAVFLCTATPTMRAGEPSKFALKTGDTVVFYGDSITEQSLYTQFVELYSITRFPDMRIHFFGAGVGGDRVSGGAGGTIEERLARDVLSHQPSVITVMLGMNDGGYTATTPEIQDAYVRGYEHLLALLREKAPAARLVLLGPSPFDDVTRPVMFPGGYNAVMRHFAELDEDLARRYNAGFVNLNPPVVAALEKAQSLNPLAARLLIPDRVHPDLIAHWTMAETLLLGWNAPALVSAVTIDGKAGELTGAQNASVEQIERRDEGLRWIELEKALPLPLHRNHATLALLLQLTDIQQTLNQEALRVTGLAAGTYKLSIDGDTIGSFSAEELTHGLNLADYETPMSAQAQRVAWGVRDRAEACRVHMRMLRAATNLKGYSGDILDAYEESLNNSNYESAIPKAHTFLLAPVSR